MRCRRVASSQSRPTETTVDTATPASWGKPHAGPYAILQVTDTGAGMTSEVKEKIFEAFFTTKEKGKGTGLGLSAVQDLAKEAGGFIQIDSEPEQGAAIKVFIPLEEEDDAGNTIGRQLVQP